MIEDARLVVEPRPPLAVCVKPTRGRRWQRLASWVILGLALYVAVFLGIVRWVQVTWIGETGPPVAYWLSDEPALSNALRFVFWPLSRLLEHRLHAVLVSADYIEAAPGRCSRLLVREVFTWPGALAMAGLVLLALVRLLAGPCLRLYQKLLGRSTARGLPIVVEPRDAKPNSSARHGSE